MLFNAMLSYAILWYPTLCQANASSNANASALVCANASADDNPKAADYAIHSIA